MELIKRDIYEITTSWSTIHGVMFRGTIRKLCIQNNVNVLLENANKEDKSNAVRFALISGLESTEHDLGLITKYIYSKLTDAKVEKIMSEVLNPILSKLKCNAEKRYEL